VQQPPDLIGFVFLSSLAKMKLSKLAACCIVTPTTSHGFSSAVGVVARPSRTYLLGKRNLALVSRLPPSSSRLYTFRGGSDEENVVENVTWVDKSELPNDYVPSSSKRQVLDAESLPDVQEDGLSASATRKVIEYPSSSETQQDNEDTVVLNAQPPDSPTEDLDDGLSYSATRSSTSPLPRNFDYKQNENDEDDYDQEDEEDLSSSATRSLNRMTDNNFTPNSRPLIQESATVQAEVVFEEFPRAKDVWNPTPADIQAQALQAKRAEAREVQSSSYIRSSCLLMALALDIVITKQKRLDLLGVMTRMDIATLGMTSVLSTSFVMAAALSYLLSTLVSYDSDLLYLDFAKRWNVFLIAFSFLNVVTYITMGKPFMGLAGTAIHTHSLLVAFNGWLKGVRGITNDAVAQEANVGVGTIIQELKNGFKSTVQEMVPKPNLLSAGFAVAACISLIRSVFTLKGIMLLAKSASIAKDVKTIIMVEYAILARHILEFGALLSLKMASDKESLLEDKKFFVLNFVVSLISGTVGIASLIQRILLGSQGPKTLLTDIIVPLSICLLSGVNSARGHFRRRQRRVF